MITMGGRRETRAEGLLDPILSPRCPCVDAPEPLYMEQQTARQGPRCARTRGVTGSRPWLVFRLLLRIAVTAMDPTHAQLWLSFSYQY
jgi:hypothetical protein